MVCNVGGGHQLRLSTAQWWEGCDVQERSVVIRQGWGVGQGPGCVSRVRAAMCSCDAQVPAV